jgi:PKD repeat protein
MRNLQVALVFLLISLIFARGVPAQSFRRAGTEFNAMRPVSLPPDRKFSVAVVQFFHHGEMAPDGRNLLVLDGDGKAVSARVLQVGPGDYCRLAIEAVAGQNSYEVFYGGKPPEADVVPPWTNGDGLLLETREYRDCNLNSLESVKQAFESSKRIGADYVDAVQHSYNPFLLTPGPFLSRYSGTLRISKGGDYGFFTSSQDCSFLLIDGKVVVDAPGRHGPVHRAAPDIRRIVNLAPGSHPFEYYHAASGPEAMMVAAWEPEPSGDKPRPQPIPPEAFRAAAIGRVDTGPVTTRKEKLVPDFLVRIAGDVPLPDEEVPLVGVQFANTSPPALTTNSKAHWDFGDGQTSDEANPSHVYLRPGLFAVKLTIKRGAKPFEMTNRIYIDRPRITAHNESKLPKLDDYLPILETYDPKGLDAVSVRQLVLAYQWKAQMIANAEPVDEQSQGEQSEEQAADGAAQEPTPAEVKQKREQEAARKAEALKYIKAAIEAGKTALTDEQSAATGDELLHQIAEIVGPMAREQAGDSQLAGQIWHGAASKIGRSDLKAVCQLHAADIALNDLVDVKLGKTLLDAAMAQLGDTTRGPAASLWKRLLGDYHAATGDGEAARKAYREAEDVLNSERSSIERAAWQGAYSRSTEEFLRNGDLDRAAAEIHAWQREFPADKINGYVTLLYGRYWEAREKYDQAVALAEQLLAVNPDSPYIDQLLVVAADCELARAKPDRALATLHSILKDYPGSPLVSEVKQKIARIESGEIEPKQPRRRTR